MSEPGSEQPPHRVKVKRGSGTSVRSLRAPYWRYSVLSLLLALASCCLHIRFSYRSSFRFFLILLQNSKAIRPIATFSQTSQPSHIRLWCRGWLTALVVNIILFPTVPFVFLILSYQYRQPDNHAVSPAHQLLARQHSKPDQTQQHDNHPKPFTSRFLAPPPNCSIG